MEFGFARFVCTEAYTGPEEPRLQAVSPECQKETIPAAERFMIMMGKYVRFDFGESYFRDISVVDLVLEKMPVSITLGLWSTLIAYLVSIPLGIRKAVRDGSSFDTWTSSIVIAAYAIRPSCSPSSDGGLCRRVLFPVVPAARPDSDNWEDLSLFGKVVDYFWHIALPVTAQLISSFATLTLLTKNSFLDEIKKHYVMTARAKGLAEKPGAVRPRLPQRDDDRDRGVPGLFLGVFFGSSLIIEYIFSLDGLGKLGYESALERDYPVMFGTLFASA